MPTLGEIARLVGGELVGSAHMVIEGVAGMDEAGPGQITFAVDLKALSKAQASKAAALIVPKDAKDVGRPHIRVLEPKMAFASVLAAFAPVYPVHPGIHPTAVIEGGVHLGRNVSVGAHVYVGVGSSIGDDVIIHPGVYIGPDVQVGEKSLLHANVVVRERTIIGKRVVLNAGCIIGADGFGFVTSQGRHQKVPQIGNVAIGDDVEIGANTCIDRATCGTTEIGRGTKIDNLVQIGHNAKVGEDCLVVAMSGIAGSAKIGNRVTLAGQTGISDHVTVGDQSVVAARGLVAGDLPPRSFVSGFPARPHPENMRIVAATRRLPNLLKRVEELEERLRALERTPLPAERLGDEDAHKGRVSGE